MRWGFLFLFQNLKKKQKQHNSKQKKKSTRMLKLKEICALCTETIRMSFDFMYSAEIGRHSYKLRSQFRITSSLSQDWAHLEN